MGSIVLNNSMLYCIEQYCVVLYRTILCFDVSYGKLFCYNVLYNIVLYSVALNNIVFNDTLG